MDEDLRILIVDDNDGFRSELSQYMEHQPGIEVVGQGRNGQEAIILALALHPDIILMDISMPGIGGLEAARRIKEQSPASKIIFVTIHDEKTYHTLASMIGVDGFVCKNNLKKDLPSILKKLEKTI
jgi:DNA-binding NarL/FixJ family response regulator